MTENYQENKRNELNVRDNKLGEQNVNSVALLNENIMASWWKETFGLSLTDCLRCISWKVN